MFAMSRKLFWSSKTTNLISKQLHNGTCSNNIVKAAVCRRVNVRRPGPVTCVTRHTVSISEDQGYLRYIHAAPKPKGEKEKSQETLVIPAMMMDIATEDPSGSFAISPLEGPVITHVKDASIGVDEDDQEEDKMLGKMLLKRLKAGDVLKQKQLLRQQLEVPGNITVDEAITLLVNQRVKSFVVVNRKREVIGLFTSKDLLRELARYPNKAAGLNAKAHEFMVPLSQMVFCSPQDSLYRCLAVMTELKIRNIPVVVDNQVAGILNVNDITDFTFSKEELGGKKAYIKNISERKGLRKGVGITSSPNNPAQHIFASVGSCALPHPFKSAGSVSANAREHSAKELATDPTLSEDAHFILSVAWPTPYTDVLHYVGVADGVGSWRACGVDPRNFPQRLMHWAQQSILTSAPQATDFEAPTPPKPHQVLSAAWEMTVADKVVGSSTACIATLDYELDQLTFSNIGDNGVVILRHIDSDVAGYMREKKTPRHLRTSDLRIAFISQQQLRSFNLPYQFGYTNVPTDNANFETPRDAVNTSFPVMPGDIVVIATDGLYDNMELEEMCDIAQEWENKWFGAGQSNVDRHDDAAMAELAKELAYRARDLSLMNNRDSPFALLAKENDIMWGGGMPDDITIVCMRIQNKRPIKFAEMTPLEEGEE